MLVDLGNGVHNRRVVLAAELTADFRERSFGELFCQIHRDLARHYDLPRVILLLQLGDTHAELLGDSSLDCFNRDLTNLGIDELLQALLSDCEGDLDPMH